MNIRSAASATAVALLALGLAACSPASVEGTWGEEGEGLPQLVLDAEGVLSGTDGCNNLIGSWTQDGATVDFGQVGATLMFCEGVDTWLSALATGTVDGNTLTILDIDGNEIGTLARQ